MKDAVMLEGAHRRTSKIIPSLRNLSYEERLKRLDMLGCIMPPLVFNVYMDAMMKEVKMGMGRRVLW